ncbi:unnamed protein product [Ectocarpus sp. 6 AP-2014]
MRVGGGGGGGSGGSSGGDSGNGSGNGSGGGAGAGAGGGRYNEREVIPPSSSLSSANASRSVSLALMAAPFEGSTAWNASERKREFDLEQGGGGGGGGDGGGNGDRGNGGGGGGEGGGGGGGECGYGTDGSRATTLGGSRMGPRFANPLYAFRVPPKGELGHGTPTAAVAAVAAATASPSAAGDMDEDDYGAEVKEGGGTGFCVGGDARDNSGIGGGAGCRVGVSPRKAVATTPAGGGGRSDSLDGGDERTTTEHDQHNEGVVAGGADFSTATTGAFSDSLGDRSNGNGAYPQPVGMEGVGPLGNGSEAADAAEALRRSSAPDFPRARDNNGKNPPLPRRRSLGDDPQARARRTAGRFTSSSSSSIAASSVLQAAEGAVAGAQSLSPLETFVPGAREVSGVVAGLARLAAASHKGDPKDKRRRVRWCRSVVLTLERALAVLGKATEQDTDAIRVALGAVREPVACMVEIVHSYKNKHVVSEVFFSTMFRRRQKEADEAILSAERLLSARQDNSESQRKTSEVILAKAERKRRHRQTVLLDEVDIPPSSLEIVEDEVLGLGGFGTVFLADLAGGLNAAAKVVTFPRGSADHGGGGGDEDGTSRAGDGDGDGDEDDDVEYDASIDTGCNNSVNDGNISSGSAPVPTVVAAAAVHDNRSPSMAGDRAVDLLPRLRIVEPSDQKARRRAVVAKAKRSAALARAEARQRQALCQELEYMKRLRGPRTVHTYGGVTALARDRMVLVMEFMPGGDLLLKLRKLRRPLEEGVLRQIVRDVCEGMTFLHSKAFVHGDLKSSNVLFDARGRAKVLRHRGATAHSDVYSFGVVLWECLSRKVPWEHVVDVGDLSMAVTSGERPEMPEICPPDLANLARACWKGDPAARPTFEAVLASLG